MRPGVTTFVGLWDVEGEHADDVVWISQSGKLVPTPLEEVLTDTLDDVAQRGAATGEVLSVGGINLAEADPEDYLELATVDSKPTIKAIGGTTVYIDSDSETHAIVEFRSDAHHLRVSFSKSAGITVLESSASIRVIASDGLDLTSAAVHNLAAHIAILSDFTALDGFLYLSAETGQLTYKLSGVFHRLT